MTFYTLGWPIYFSLLFHTFGLKEKISRNYVSFTHSVLCSIITYFVQVYKYNDSTLNSLFYNFSTGYFLWDTIYIFMKNTKKRELPFIYHHLVCLYILNDFTYNEL